MPTGIAQGEGIPAAFYRNAIDLNRFSNSVSKKIVNSYNNVILKAVEQLETIEKQPRSKQPAYKAARLRALIKQTKESLNTWAGGSVDELIAELEGVAKVQAGFIEDQLKKSIPRGMTEKIHDQIGSSINSVAVSPSFAKSVVNTDPTALNLSVLKSDLAGTKTPKGTFRLTAKQGQTITLPNGDVVKKAFRGLAQSQAKRFNQVVRTGLLSGDPTADIVRQMVGTLSFGQEAKTLKQIQLAGGELTKMANGQVMTIVRTTVNQVTNTASQAVYKANPDVTEEYRYVATLDSRTSPVCRDLDGQIFKYNEGPVPPQHFGCRSTTVAVINYKKWGFTPPPAGKRASADGPVPANTTYGKWLYDQRKPNTKFQAGSEQIAALGTNKAKYFNRLANKYGPDQALKKLIREDNTEVSLTQLQKRYGKPEDIKKTTKAKATKAKTAALEKSTAQILKDIGVDPAAVGKLSKQIAKQAPATASKQSITQKLKKGQQKMKANIEKLDKEMAETKKQITQAKADLKALDPSPAKKVATLQKLDDSTKNVLENFKKADLTNKKHQNWFNNQKIFNSTLIPKGKFNTITPKELGKLVEKDKVTKLQQKYDKAYKKSLLPSKPVVPRDPLKKWDDKSFIQENIASTDKTTPPPPRKAVKKGKTKTKDLLYEPDRRNAMSQYDLSGSQFDSTKEQVGEWTGNNYRDIRGLQIKQAKLAGKQLNPNEIKQLRQFESRSDKGIVNLTARNADKLENYVAKTPKWNGSAADVRFGDTYYDKQPDGTVFRGMTVNNKNIVEDVIQNLKRGEAVTTMESWSSDARTAMKFAKGEIGSGNHGIMLRHVNKHGAPIEVLNGMDESEILQPSGVRYKLISKKTKNWTETVKWKGGQEIQEHSMTEIVLEAI